jgi:hypothetical protein
VPYGPHVFQKCAYAFRRTSNRSSDGKPKRKRLPKFFVPFMEHDFEPLLRAFSIGPVAFMSWNSRKDGSTGPHNIKKQCGLASIRHCGPRGK